jgi:hypothetical protein
MKVPVVLAVALVASTAIACERTTAPPSAGGLTLAVRIAPVQLGLPPFASFTRTLTNTSDATLTVVFTGCGVLPYVATADGRVVHPNNGVWGCVASVSSVTLAPGEAIVGTEYLQRGDGWAYARNTITLPPGRYRAFAEADARLGTYDGPRVQLRSLSEWFQVER